MEIVSEGIVLRPWTISDALVLARIADNKKIADNLRDLFPSPYLISDARKWIRSVLLFDPPQNFAIIYEDTVAGNIGIVTKNDVYRRNIEIGYFVDEKFWGRGIATRAIRAVTSFAFSNFDVVRVYANVFAGNRASAHALEKAGFRLEAVLRNSIIKNGVTKDECIYSVLRENFMYDLQPARTGG
jgi:[ribosomal protein S5]-alanine N-acetyltransferase